LILTPLPRDVGAKCRIGNRNLRIYVFHPPDSGSVTSGWATSVHVHGRRPHAEQLHDGRGVAKRQDDPLAFDPGAQADVAASRNGFRSTQLRSTGRDDITQRRERSLAVVGLRNVELEISRAVEQVDRGDP
jgi:hypothetical protein